MTEDDDFPHQGPRSPILTPRLRLRMPDIGDAEAMARLADDRHIADMLSVLPHPYGIDDAIAFIETPRKEIALAVTARDGGAFLGVVSLKPGSHAKAVDVGYWLGRPFWGQGLATEAVQAMVDFGFEHLAIDCVEVSCRVINGASRRVIGKCGFQFCGTGMIASLAAGRVATERYHMDRRSWASLKAWGRQSAG
ncbi:GNAT family N-acetyltransferase [Aurantimonas sp. MSK8Z-1]|uniref:GNAT family N-acetyltransferase n=1 Tax=Mangrovibrevibacter kandeliae TaxID=2968473 RepID=UPI002118C19E|nr:GNAT family N-acetyltransferase [Aurantimonas sp. MSK8Z-1]MCW4116284.1 GNAT family N-acetyltransferase [Aurantimonas sp. MSK8Z-1]